MSNEFSSYGFSSNAYAAYQQYMQGIQQQQGIQQSGNLTQNTGYSLISPSENSNTYFTGGFNYNPEIYLGTYPYHGQTRNLTKNPNYTLSFEPEIYLGTNPYYKPKYKTNFTTNPYFQDISIFGSNLTA